MKNRRKLMEATRGQRPLRPHLLLWLATRNRHVLTRCSAMGLVAPCRLQEGPARRPRRPVCAAAEVVSGDPLWR
jgi:hypothetical protein